MAMYALVWVMISIHLQRSVTLGKKYFGGFSYGYKRINILMINKPAEAIASAGLLFSIIYRLSLMSYQRNINNYTLYRFFYSMLMMGLLLALSFLLPTL
ncbi:MAG: putative membrane protein [Candidatus Latescibacterota bacterium]|jgi:uncharacterized membrane protein